MAPVLVICYRRASGVRGAKQDKKRKAKRKDKTVAVIFGALYKLENQ